MGDKKSHDQVAMQDQNPQDLNQDNKDTYHDPGVDPFGHQDNQNDLDGDSPDEDSEPKTQEQYEENGKKNDKKELLNLATLCPKGEECSIPGCDFVTIKVLKRGEPDPLLGPLSGMADLKFSLELRSPKDPSKKKNFNFPSNGYIIRGTAQTTDTPLVILMSSIDPLPNGSPDGIRFEIRADGSYEMQHYVGSGITNDNNPLNDTLSPIQEESGTVDGLRTTGELGQSCLYELGSNRLEVDHHQKTFKISVKNKQKWSVFYEAKSDALELHSIKVSQSGEASVVLAKADGQKLKQSFHLKDRFAPNFVPLDAAEIKIDNDTNDLLSQIAGHGIIIHDNTHHITFNGAKEILNLIEKADAEIKSAVKSNTIRIWVTPEIASNGTTSQIIEEIGTETIKPSLIWVHARFQDVSSVSGLTTTEKAIVHEIAHAIDLILDKKITTDLTSLYNIINKQEMKIKTMSPAPSYFKPDKDNIFASELVSEKFLGLTGGHPGGGVEEFVASFVASARLVPDRLTEVIIWAEQNQIKILTSYVKIWTYFYHKGIIPILPLL